MKKSRMIQIIKRAETPDEALKRIIEESNRTHCLDSKVCKYPCADCSKAKDCFDAKDCKSYLIWFKKKWVEVTKELKR